MSSSETKAVTSAEVVVQRQLDAFNARDVDALLRVYADDAKLFEHPATLLANGAAELRARFSARFTDPMVRAVLLNRVVSGHMVVDHERVRRTFPDGVGEVELVMIYEVRGDRIANAWTIPGPRVNRAGAA